MKKDPIQFIKNAHNKIVLAQDIMTFGNSEKFERTYGAVSKLWFGNLEVVEKMMEITKKSRPGKKLKSVEFIVVHDTGNNNPKANASLHARYLEIDPGVSWHYTVDDQGVYHNLPDDEVGHHAGDGLRDLELMDTGVKNTTRIPVIKIDDKGYYLINDQPTSIKAPEILNRVATTADITPSGIFTVVGENGNYYMNKTYYNDYYKLIANQGGGTRGIGIESCVDEGSNLYATWQHLAKLVAKLLKDNQLGLERVLQHNHFSGKPCPQTLRTAKLWDMFLEMVAFEYELITSFKDYKFEFESNNLDIVDNTGRIINQPHQNTSVEYTVTIKNGNYSESVRFFSKIPGLEVF